MRAMARTAQSLVHAAAAHPELNLTAEKIGYIASRLATMERPADKYREIKHLGRVVSEMVHDALDASVT